MGTQGRRRPWVETVAGGFPSDIHVGPDRSALVQLVKINVAVDSFRMGNAWLPVATSTVPLDKLTSANDFAPGFFWQLHYARDCISKAPSRRP